MWKIFVAKNKTLNITPFLAFFDAKMTDKLIEFYGTECAHCKDMEPIIEKLQKEKGIKIARLEVWHNSDNAKFMKEVDKDKEGNEFCGGVPFFYNEKTGKKICGNTSFEKLKAWAEGK